MGGQDAFRSPRTRSFDDQSLLLAINTDPHLLRSAWVSLDPIAYPVGAPLTCLYSSAPDQIGQGLAVQSAGERHIVRLDVPSAGFVIYE